MLSNVSRRSFLNSSVAAGLGSFAFLDALPAPGAAGPVLPPVATVASDVEPLVRLIEETPRPRILERIVEQIRKGVTYQELLSAVFLAGVRGIQPRPVGFKFHAVLVINSAHLASLASSDRERWLPLLWSIDYFKNSQAQNEAQGDWHMAPPDESKLPADHQARERFIQAMERWEPEEADRAITAWVRTASASEVFEPLWRLGARDFRDIGHKAIFVANGWRTLQTIGWRHAEPVMRSLAYALLDHEGGNPSRRDDWRDQPGRENLQLATKLGAFRHSGKRDAAVPTEVLTTLRKASVDEASKLTADLIRRGIHPACIWDGLFLFAGELLMRQPGIVGLHTLTSLNALHFAYETAPTPTTRAFLLLQASAFLPLFHDFMRGRGKLAATQIDKVEATQPKEGVGEILADISRDRMQAARKTVGLLTRSPGQLEELMRGARRLIFAKGTDSHDYKFSSAVLEDAYQLPASLRPGFMAASMFNLKGSGDRDNNLIVRARAALAKAT